MNHFKEYIIEQADLRKYCMIKFKSANGAISTLRDRIARLKSVSEMEILETESGLAIRMDQVIQINDIVAGDFC